MGEEWAAQVCRTVSALSVQRDFQCEDHAAQPFDKFSARIFSPALPWQSHLMSAKPRIFSPALTRHIT